MKKITLISVCLQLSACNLWQGMTAIEEVKPWQRDVLAKESMQLPPDSLHKYTDEHIYFSKEGSTGGDSVGGGGCGCN